jgi:hypothetical protein
MDTDACINKYLVNKKTMAVKRRLCVNPVSKRKGSYAAGPQECLRSRFDDPFDHCRFTIAMAAAPWTNKIMKLMTDTKIFTKITWYPIHLFILHNKKNTGSE